MNVVFACGFLTWRRIGYELVRLDKDETGGQRMTWWGTPRMFGNNGRAPIFPYIKPPYADDFEEVVQYRRKVDKRDTALVLEFHTVLYHSWYHPAREDADD